MQPTAAATAVDDQWPAYAGPAGARFSALDEITTANVSRLQVAWTYRTGELGQNARDGAKLTFEATPIHFDGRLYLATAFGRVIALDPATGAEVWHFDAGVDRAAPLQRGDLARGVGLARRRGRPGRHPARGGSSPAPSTRGSSRSTPRPAGRAPPSAPAGKCGWHRAPEPTDRPTTR